MSRDPQVRVAALLAARHPFGVIRDDGVPVGCWFSLSSASRVGRDDPVTVTVLRREGAVARAAHVTAHGVEPTAATLDAALHGRAQDGIEVRRRAQRGGPAVTFGWSLGTLTQAIALVGVRDARWSHDARHVLAASVRHRYPAMPHGASMLAADRHLARLSGALAPFLLTLDRDALTLAEREGLHAVVGDAWPAFDDTFGTGAPLKAAMSQRPDLAATLVSMWTLAPESFAMTVASGGADGAVSAWLRGEVGLPPRLVACFGHARAATLTATDDALRAMRDAPWAALPRGAVSPPLGAQALAFARPLPGNWVSADARWDDLVACFPVLRKAWDVAGTANLPAFLSFGGDWDAWRRRLVAVSGGGSVPSAIDDLGDVAKAFARQVLNPVLVAWGLADAWERDPSDDRSVERRLAWAALFRGRSLRTCLDASRRWHVSAATMEAALRRLPRVDGEVVEGVGDGDWGAGLPDWSSEGTDLVVLRTEAELADEGRPGEDGKGVAGLSHCVGGYVDDCLSGRSRIVSVRRPAGRGGFVRLSTAELRLTDGDAVDVRQHKGRSNEAPPTQASRVLDAYLGALRSKALRVDPEGWRAVPHARTAGRPPYDPGVQGNVEAALALWEPFLPGHLRDVGPRGWAVLAVGFVDEPRTHPWRPVPVAAPEPAPDREPGPSGP